jgi:hypothetical protein
MLAGFSLVLFSGITLAEDLEGRIESINKGSQSFVVQGIEFFVTPSTDYDDGLTGFDDLREGQKVEVDFQYRDGKHYATEIELED